MVAKSALARAGMSWATVERARLARGNQSGGRSSAQTRRDLMTGSMVPIQFPSTGDHASVEVEGLGNAELVVS